MNSLIQSFIQTEISYLMNNLNKLFPKDELAYFSLQGKNELQIRDKVAWELQTKVLEVDPNNTDKSEPVAILEFKAQSFVNKEDWFFGSFYLDVKNMWAFCAGGKEVDMYFIFLHSTQNQKHVSGGYGDAITYKDIFDHKNTFLSTDPSLHTVTSTIWNGFYSNAVIKNSLFTTKGYLKKHFHNATSVGNPPQINYNVKFAVPKPVFQSVGKSFGYEWFVAPMIWGPFKYGDLNIN